MKVCIFCGGSPVTGEHVFPNWLNDLFTGLGNRMTAAGEKVVYEPVQTHEYERQRSLGRIHSTWKVPVACGPCNNGWMSVLQNDAKPMMQDMIAGRSTNLSLQQQSVLVKWIVMFCIVAEFTNPDERARGIPVGDRGQLRSICVDGDPIALEGWIVGIGRYTGEGWPMFYDHTFHESGAQPYAQSSTAVIGQLFIQAWRSSVGTARSEEKTLSAGGLLRLWPSAGIEVGWPLAQGIDDEGLNFFSTLLRRHFEADVVQVR